MKIHVQVYRYSPEIPSLAILKYYVLHNVIFACLCLGIFEFKKPGYIVSEGEVAVAITIVRKNGTRGRVEIALMATDVTAKNSSDYVFGVPQIEFANGEVCAILKTYANFTNDRYLI